MGGSVCELVENSRCIATLFDFLYSSCFNADDLHPFFVLLRQLVLQMHEVQTAPQSHLGTGEDSPVQCAV